MNHIFFHKLVVGELSKTSAIFKGKNKMSHWRHSAKVNEGFGIVLGDQNSLVSNQNILADQDWVDTYQTKKKG